jgi:hypothetical protein
MPVTEVTMYTESLGGFHSTLELATAAEDDIIAYAIELKTRDIMSAHIVIALQAFPPPASHRLRQERNRSALTLYRYLAKNGWLKPPAKVMPVI